MACYRIARVIADEDGPVGLIKSFRFWIQKLAANKRNIFTLSLAEFVNCPFCIGIWLSGLLVYVWSLAPHWSEYIVLVFGISGVQDIIQSGIDKLHPRNNR